MLNRIAYALVVTALSISPAASQMRGGTAAATGFGISAGLSGSSGSGSAGSGSAGFGSAGMGHGIPPGSGHVRPGHASGRREVLLPYPYFYSDYDPTYDVREISQPQVIVVPASAPEPPPAPPAPRESLLIEWQGDRFVRTTMSVESPSGGTIAPDYSEKSVPASPVVSRTLTGQLSGPISARRDAVEPARPLPPAVLVFHDGRKEEVSEYTIMSGIIYSKADYWTTGSWSRKIQIADLDVPATLSLNRERGVKFVLPASPNEVVIRP